VPRPDLGGPLAGGGRFVPTVFGRRPSGTWWWMVAARDCDAAVSPQAAVAVLVVPDEAGGTVGGTCVGTTTAAAVVGITGLPTTDDITDCAGLLVCKTGCADTATVLAGGRACEGWAVVLVLPGGLAGGLAGRGWDGGAVLD
jgi:hypothetical protein